MTRGRRKASRRLLVSALALVAAACGDDAFEQVRVCGDLAVPDDLIAVRVSVLDADLVERSAGVTELGDADGVVLRQLPVEVSIAAGSGQHVVRVQAVGPEGAEIARADVLVSGTSSDVVIVNLARECVGQLCALGQTCVGGDCTVIPDADRSQRCAAPMVADPTVTP